MRRRLIGACMLALIGASTVTQAQSYTNRVIRIIVPFVAGGPTDVNARMVAQKLTDAWSQSVIVDNRPSAGGLLGTELVAKALPDGYTLLGANPGPLTVAPSLNPKLAYDPVRQLTPVILVTNTTSVLAVHPSIPVKSVKELIALARQKPGRLTYGTPGVGTVGHLTWEQFAHQAKVQLMHIPYKGTAQATTDFLGGQLDLRSFSVPFAIPLMKAGKARILGINSLKRSPIISDIPTVDEAGLKGFESGNWSGIMAPAGTPREIIARLYEEITRRIIKSDTRELLIRDGYEVTGLGPDKFAAYMQAETAKWARVIKNANIKIE